MFIILIMNKIYFLKYIIPFPIKKVSLRDFKLSDIFFGKNFLDNKTCHCDSIANKNY